VAERNELDLEAMLRDVGARMSYPPAADLLPAVRARIEAPAPRGSLLDLLRSPLQLAPALATLALLLLATLAFQPVAGQAAEALGLRGITLFRVPEPARSPGIPAPFLPPDAQRVSSVEQAAQRVGFDVRVPTELGAPDAIYVRTVDRASFALLTYGTRFEATLPPQPGGPKPLRTPLLITELRGSLETALLGKTLPPGTRVEELEVNGGRGVWIEGEPHEFFYRAANGDILTDTVRLAGNVLLWEQDGTLMRIEAQIPRDEALRIARSMR
jgi:hypothetical protein